MDDFKKIIESADKESVEKIDKIFNEFFGKFIDEKDSLNMKENLYVFASFLSLDDKNFDILSPIMLDNLRDVYESINMQLSIKEMLAKDKNSINELLKIFNKLEESISKVGLELGPKKESFINMVFSIIVNTITSALSISERVVKVPIEISPEVKILPTYAHLSDSGMDIFALDDYEIMPGETKLIPTGIKVAIPNGYELQVRPKSGRALKTKLRVANTPGTIDAGYRDEVKVIIENIEPAIKDIKFHYDEDKLVIDSIEKGKPYNIGKNEKFAQLVLCEVPKVAFVAVKDINIIDGDRGGGFGSTGLKN